MKRLVLVALLFAALPAAAQTWPILFTDNFDADTSTDYSHGCFAGSDEGTVWQVVDSALRGTSPNGDGCWAEAGDPTWGVQDMTCRTRRLGEAVRGISLYGPAGHIGLTMDSADGRFEIFRGGDLHSRTVVTLRDATWFTIQIGVSSIHLSVWVNGDYVFFDDLAPGLVGRPFTDVRFWVAGGGTVEFDDIFLYGSGVSPVEATGWGALKSRYR